MTAGNARGGYHKGRSNTKDPELKVIVMVTGKKEGQEGGEEGSEEGEEEGREHHRCLCAQYVLKPLGVQSLVPKCDQYAPATRPLCVPYVCKPVWGSIDAPTGGNHASVRRSRRALYVLKVSLGSINGPKLLGPPFRLESYTPPPWETMPWSSARSTSY